MRRAKVQRGPEVSKDPLDKMIAAMSWWRAWYKGRDPEYIRAPHYYDAILQWHENLSLDNVETCALVDHIYVTPSYGGPRGAQECAEKLPAVPVPPDAVRARWITAMNSAPGPAPRDSADVA